ncbi:hypothetical protein PHPALM_29257, partial [Phytophthora palmivora]
LNLSLQSARIIQTKLEEDLLRHEARISAPHRKRGHHRVITSEPSCYTIDKTVCESLSNIIHADNLSLEEATNHGSCRRYLRVGIRSIREGQNPGQTGE